jgi:hypothetical protein
MVFPNPDQKTTPGSGQSGMSCGWGLNYAELACAMPARAGIAKGAGVPNRGSQAAIQPRGPEKKNVLRTGVRKTLAESKESNRASV